MKHLKLATIFFAILMTAAIFAAVFPFVPDRASAVSVDDNYYFRSMDLSLEVGKDKTFRVTETMEVFYRYGGVNTGIIRDVQRFSRTTRRIDGETKEGGIYYADLTDVTVTLDGGPAKVTRSLYDEGQFHSVKMQRPDGLTFDSSDEDGTHTFVLSYRYDVSDDDMGGFDDVTYDLLGYAMARCERFTATVVFPGEFDLTGYSVRSGSQFFAPDAEKGEFVRMEGNTLSLCAVGRAAGSGLTLQALFPDGSFSLGGKHFFPAYLIACFALIAGMVGSFVLLWRYSPRKPIESVEFYPPEGMSLARYSAVWHGKAKRGDLAAYFLKWAADGCVRLTRDGRKHFTAEKTGELPEGAPAEERALFDGILRDGIFSTKNVPMSQKRYYSGVLDGVETRANTPDPMVGNKKRFTTLIVVFSLLPMLGMLIYLCLMYQTFVPLFFLIFMAAGTAAGVSILGSSGFTLIGLIFPAAFMGMPLFAICSTFYMPLYDYAFLLWVAVAWWAVSFFFPSFYGRRTEEAQRLYGRMCGFKTFLLTAEVERIEALLKDRPDYFYSVIPYCLVMGIGKKIKERYGMLSDAFPEWSDWDMVAISHVMVSATVYRSSSSSSSHGGGGGGGGFGGSSGGGGGGGGSRGC